MSKNTIKQEYVITNEDIASMFNMRESIELIYKEIKQGIMTWAYSQEEIFKVESLCFKLEEIDAIRLNGSQGHRLEYYINKNIDYSEKNLKHLRVSIFHNIIYKNYKDDVDKLLDDIILYKAYDSIIKMKEVLSDGEGF